MSEADEISRQEINPTSWAWQNPCGTKSARPVRETLSEQVIERMVKAMPRGRMIRLLKHLLREERRREQ